MFIKLCNKYRVKVAKYNIEGQPFFNSLSKSISSIKEIKSTDLQALFSEINLSIICYDNGTFTVSHEQKILLSNIDGPKLLNLMKQGFSLDQLLAVAEDAERSRYANYQMKNVEGPNSPDVSNEKESDHVGWLERFFHPATIIGILTILFILGLVFKD